MKYIYDVLLNFQVTPYDFYEWNNEDYISHIRKIPAFKINDEVMYDLLNYNVLFDNSFLKHIINKCEIFTKKGVKRIKYSFIVSDSNTALAFLLDNSGKTIKASKLLLDEDDEVCDFSSCLETINLKYKIINNRKIFEFKSRNEIDIENKIRKNLENIKIKKDTLQMQYLYYECFNEKKSNINEMYNIFMNEITNNYSNVIPKLNSIFNMLLIINKSV